MNDIVDEPQTRGEFDYSAPAEVFVRGVVNGRSSLAYRRFATAAEAISYVMDELPANRRAGAMMEVLERRFDPRDIENLALTPRKDEARLHTPTR